VKEEAAADPNKLTVLLSWMSSNGLAKHAVEWVQHLPPDATALRSVSAAVAGCYVAAQDWEGLSQWCRKTNWSDLEFLRHAYLARAARGRSDELTARAEWNAATRDAGANSDWILALEETAVKWSWKTEAEQLLWTLAKNPDKQQAALASLGQYYTEKGQTAELYHVASRLAEINPQDEAAQNNVAQLSLLLNVNTNRARTEAEQLYRKHPDQPGFASTYAFSLYYQGQYREAVRVMDKLRPEELLEPGVSAYYGIFLTAAGEKVKGASYLEHAGTAKLLPEEKALVVAAQKTISESGGH
jgi:hypothetical protein